MSDVWAMIQALRPSKRAVKEMRCVGMLGALDHSTLLRLGGPLNARPAGSPAAEPPPQWR